MNLDEFSQPLTCAECGGPAFSDLILAEKKDACYAKVRSRYRVWPSAYASGALVQCRKKGAANWGNKSKTEEAANPAQQAAIAIAMKKAGKKPKQDMSESQLAEKCWDTHRQAGMKKKGNRMVPNCVPKESVSEAAASDILFYAKLPDGYKVYARVQDQSQLDRLQKKYSGNETKTLPYNNPNVQQWLQSRRVDLARFTPGMVQTVHDSVFRPTGLDTATAQKTTDVAEDQLAEKWSEKYKRSINCANPRGFSQRAHCAGRNKNEDREMNPEYDDEAGMAHGSLHTMKNAVEGLMSVIDDGDNLPEWCQEKLSLAEDYLVTVWDYLQSEKAQGVDPEIAEMYEAMEDLVEEMAARNGVSADRVWEQFEAMPDNVLYETAAWRRKEGKSKKGGLNRKGVASYRREHPGSKLQMAVTTKPSKLKPGSKAAKRRKSFCARMSGVKGPMKKPNGKPTRKALALRKWNC